MNPQMLCQLSRTLFLMCACQSVHCMVIWTACTAHIETVLFPLEIVLLLTLILEVSFDSLL